MSAQSAKPRFHSITTIIKELRVAGLWLEKGTEWAKAKDHLKPTRKKDTKLLNSLCNILVRGPRDVVAALIVVQQSGAQILVAQSSLCVRATNLKEPRFQAPTVAIEPPSDFEGVLNFVLEHVRSFNNNNGKISFKNHADIITSFLRRIYEAQDKNQLTEVERLLICYVLGMSLPKTIERLYTKSAGLPQYVEIFKTEFRKELLGDMTAVFRVEDKHVTNLLRWAKKLLMTRWSPSYYIAALEQLEMVNPSSMKFTEKIAALVHDILHTVLTRLFVVRMVKLDLKTLRAAIQAQLSLSSLLSELKPFVEAYLHIIDPEKLDQSLSEKDSSCAIIDVVEEEELSGAEEDEENNEIEVMKDDRKPWSEICSYLLKRIALIAASTLRIASPRNVHPSLNRLLKSSSVTAIEPGHRDMKMEHWEDTVDYLLKDTHNAERIILKDNLRKIMCKTASLVFSNDENGDSMKPKSTNTLKCTGSYHCELALMAFLFRAKSDVQRPEDGTSMMEPGFFQRVQAVKLGLSKPCCLICSYVICRICKTDSLSSVTYSGHRNHVYPCTLPDDLPDAVLSETQLWVEALLRNHLTSTRFRDQLNSHLKSLHLANGSTASKEANASMSPEFPRDRRSPFDAAFF